MKQKSKKQIIEELVPDSDEHFAYVAGYTEGGVPYGVTREEMEAARQAESTRRAGSPPPQKAPLALHELAQEMQMTFDTMTIYFRRSTGEFVPVSEEHVQIVDAEAPFDDRPEWEQEAIRMAADVLADTEGDYVELPSRYDIHEYAIMEDFCRTVDQAKIAADLFRSISGKGAFRRFKDTIRRLGIENDWYRFKDEAYRAIARDWCRENGITWRE